MYRTFLLVLLSTHAAISAPQESRESSITYLKVQPPAPDTSVDAQNYRSYGFVPKSAKKSSKNSPIVSDKKDQIVEELDAKVSTPEVHEVNPPDNNNVTNVPKTVDNLSNQNVSKDNQTEIDSTKPETPEKDEKPYSDPNIEETKVHKNLLKDTFENLDNLETSQFDRHSRDYDYTTNTYDSSETEIADYSTERNDNLGDIRTAKSSPKLTYFQKYGGSFSNNLIESSGKRRFRSRCRCEKIWNCPKLQITVPRCPEEYFLCCF